MDWYLLAFRRYAEFSGRSNRKEYWYFQLFNLLIAMSFLGMAVIGDPSDLRVGVNVIALLFFFLATLIPSLAVMVRRLHDAGHSGWWYFVNWIPVVGPLVFLIFMVEQGDRGPNMYGPEPEPEPHR